MANHDVSSPSFNPDLRKLEITDRAHADVFNDLFEQLINNDVAQEDGKAELEAVDSFPGTPKPSTWYLHKADAQTSGATVAVELMGADGKSYYLHTDADHVFCEDGTTVQDMLDAKFDKANIVQNATTNDGAKVPSAAVAKSLQDQITTLNSKIVTAGAIAGGASMTFAYTQAALLYIFRKQNSTSVVYAFDSWGYASVVGGAESTDITVTIASASPESSKSVTVSNAKNGLVQYMIIIR